MRVAGGGEPILGAFEHQRGKRGTEGVIDGLEGLPGSRKPVRQILPHPHPLRALARAEPDGAYHFTTMLAQVNPAPNATSSTVIPGCKRPVRRASSKAIATDAADVLP